MKYHGNYCGPYWSAGEAQPSVVSDVPAIDEFDETCKVHDAVYAVNGDLSRADHDFYASNVGHGFKRSVAALAVKMQQLVLGQSRNKNLDKDSTMTKKTTKNLRGSNATQSAPMMRKQSKQPQINLSAVPAAYGYSLKMQPPRVVRKGDQASIVGSDFASVLRISNSANYEPSASVFVNPIYFQSSMLGSLARTYEKFRVRSCALQYIPSVPTNTPGQLVMCSTSTVKEPFIAGTASTFLARALSQHNAVATPLWKEAIIEHSGGPEWYTVDALIDGDLDDAIAQEFQCYTLGANAQDAGILILHYELEFKEPLYTYHPTLIPVPIGNGSFITAVDDSAVNAVNDSIRLVNMSPSLAPAGNGSIFRLVFQAGVSTAPIGPANWAAVAQMTYTSATTTSTGFVGSSAVSLVTGTTFYGLWDGFALTLYGSLETAQSGGNNGNLVYRAATTAVGTWTFVGQLVRINPLSAITTQ